MPAELRPLRAGDIDRVVEIEKDTFADAWSKRSFEGMLKEAHIFSLGVDDGRGTIIGYGMCSLVADEGEILNIAVHRGSRRLGIGKEILKGLLGHLSRGGARQAWLEVRRSNEPAIEMYRAAGFTSQGVRASYYAKPREDALTMALELGSQSARK